MIGYCCLEGLRYKRPMVPLCIALLLALVLAPATATPRQDQREPRLVQLDAEVETATEDYEVEFIEGRIVGGKPVFLLRKRAHGGGTASKTSSSASGAKSPGTKGRNDSTSTSSGSGEAKRPPWKTTGRPTVGEEGLRPESSSWRPSLSGAERPRETNGFDSEHRGGLASQNREVPWNHQGVSPGYSSYPAPVTSAYTDDDSPRYIPNTPATPNTYTPSIEQQPSLSSRPTSYAGSQGGGGIITGHPPTNTFTQREVDVNRPRQGGDIIVGSASINRFGGHLGGFNQQPPQQELDQARRGVVHQQHPQQGAGSFGLPSLPSNPFAPSNSGFHVPGVGPLPFGAGLFNPGLVNIQKAVEQAAAGVLGAAGAGVNPTAANVFGRTSTFGQTTSFGFTDRK